MEEKRIIVLVVGSKEDYDNGRAFYCTSIFSHEVDCVWLERKPDGKHLLTVMRRNGKNVDITIENETQAASAYSSILKFLVNSEKLLHVFSE